MYYEKEITRHPYIVSFGTNRHSGLWFSIEKYVQEEWIYWGKEYKQNVLTYVYFLSYEIIKNRILGWLYRHSKIYQWYWIKYRMPKLREKGRIEKARCRAKYNN